jgi:hypothetical protein
MDERKTEYAALMRAMKSLAIMKHTGKTKEMAMRIDEFEFCIDPKNKTLKGLEYWIGRGRRTSNRRHIDLENDNFNDSEIVKQFFKMSEDEEIWTKYN